MPIESRHRRLAGCAALSLAAGAHCSGGASDPSALSEEQGVAVATGAVRPAAAASLCLDVVGQSTANGAPVQVWSCTGNANQQWTYDGTSLRVYGSKCLDVTGGDTANGTRLQIWDCVDGSANQRWTRSGSALQWTGHGKCVDLTNGAAKNGTPVQSWSCAAGDANQAWTLGGGTSSGGGSGGGTSSGGGSGGGGSGGGGLNPNVPPGGNFDLSGWQLQLPTGSTGSPEMISGTQLAGAAGFTDIYFRTDETDGAMTFMDPATGVTTSGSKHPRSELRELAIWSTAGTNTETVTLAVTQVPGTVTIGQIFQAPPAPSKPLMELQYIEGGTLQVLLEDTNQGGSSTFHPVGTVADGSKFTYELSLTGTTIRVAINGAVSTLSLPSSFVGESFYFKCGDYDQDAVAGTPGTSPGSVVKVYALDVVHQ